MSISSGTYDKARKDEAHSKGLWAVVDMYCIDQQYDLGNRLVDGKSVLPGLMTDARDLLKIVSSSEHHGLSLFGKPV
jgi:hypothetical protein